VSAVLVGQLDAYAQDAGTPDEASTGSDSLPAVGTLRFEITVCKNDLLFAKRRVAVYTSNSEYSARGAATTLLNTAVKYVQEHCPQHFIFPPDKELSGYRQNVTSADVYYPDGSIAIHADFYNGDNAYNVGKTYEWGQISFPADVQRQARNEAAARLQRQAAVQVATEHFVAVRNAWWSNVWDTITAVFWSGVTLCIVVWLFARRYAIARWYFFTFHPHPAERTVQSAISAGTLLNGNQLAAILGEVPPCSSVFRQVRFEQSTALIDAMQDATQMHLRELQTRAKEQYEQAAVQQAQAALGQAAVALEQAKAMLNASKRSAQT
jgi:hypothetical protein